MQLAEITTNAVQDYLDRKRTILLPFGATEQHGPHLPIGTDTIIAEALARAAGERSGTMIAPALPVGFSPGLHSHFAGTVSFKAATYLAVIEDLLDSLLAAGFHDFLLLTGHGLNYSPLKTALLDFLDRRNARALLLGYWELDEVQPLVEPGDGTHCTIMETALLLYLREELVDMRKAIDEYRRPRFLLGRDYARQISQTGIVAETTKATCEKGRQFFEAAVSGLARVLREFDRPELFVP
jgi:creatinine amidohydrolase